MEKITKYYICPDCGRLIIPSFEGGTYACSVCGSQFTATIEYREIMTCTDNYHDQYTLHITPCKEHKNNATVVQAYDIPLRNGSIAVSYAEATSSAIDVPALVKSLPREIFDEYNDINVCRQLPEFEVGSRNAIYDAIKAKANMNAKKHKMSTQDTLIRAYKRGKIKATLALWFYNKGIGALIFLVSFIACMLMEGMSIIWLPAIICIGTLIALIAPIAAFVIANV